MSVPRKTEVLSVRLTKEDMRRVKTAAAEQQLHEAAWAREVLLGRRPGVPIINKEQSDGGHQ